MTHTGKLSKMHKQGHCGQGEGHPKINGPHAIRLSWPFFWSQNTLVCNGFFSTVVL